MSNLIGIEQNELSKRISSAIKYSTKLPSVIQSQISKEKNLPRMMSIQNVYNLVNRVFDIHNSEVSIRESCGLLAYSPLAGGRLSGKYIGGKNPKNARYTIWISSWTNH